MKLKTKKKILLTGDSIMIIMLIGIGAGNIANTLLGSFSFTLIGVSVLMIMVGLIQLLVTENTFLKKAHFKVHKYFSTILNLSLASFLFLTIIFGLY